MSTSQHSIQQTRIAEILSKQYGISIGEVYFLNPKKPDEPWLTAAALMTIARQSPEILEVSERYDRYIEALQQIVYVGTVALKDGRTFQRSGVATIGEKLPGGDEADEHELAAARAIRKVLDAAGFNPLSTPSDSRSTDRSFDDAMQRSKDLARIHLLAGQAELITQKGNRRDDVEYRRFLKDHCSAMGREGVTTASELNQAERASLIAALEVLLNPEMV